MKPARRILLELAALTTFAWAVLPISSAQTPSGAPPGSTGICKDGSYSTAASKDGACRGHKGVQTWYSAVPAPTGNAKPVPPAPASASAVAPPASPPAASPSPSPQTPTPPKSGISAERARLAAAQPAPGGGPGLVWLNGSSSVYHCPGSEFYGKTKKGAYLSEADAKAKGAHPDHNKPCS